MTPAVRWRAFVNTAFSSRYLLYTNCALSVGLSGAGDVLQQTVRHMRDPNRPISARRIFNMSVSSLSFGVLSHYWYIWLDRRFVGRTIRTVLIKVALDQVILSPIMWIVYIGVLTLIERAPMKKFKLRLYNAATCMYVAEWCVWPPAQVFNFYYLPTHYRVLYVNTISLAFDWYSSYLLHDQHHLTNMNLFE